MEIGFIDEPIELEDVGRFVRVRGWTVAGAELYIDDIPLGEVRPFIRREDVERAFPDIKMSKPTGFDLTFAMPDISPGLHTLSLKSVGRNSARTLCARRVKYNDEIENTVGLEINIEMSRMCNFSCEMCPAHSEKAGQIREKLFADDALIDRIVPFLGKSNHKIRSFYAGAVWGEPLMNRRYFENIRRVARACPGASAKIITNGSFLTRQNLDRLFSLGCMSQIMVSVDAGTKATYERIRKGGSWEALNQNLSALVEEKKRRRLEKPEIATNFVIMKVNFEEFPLYVRRMAQLGVDAINAVNAHGFYSSDCDQGIYDLPGIVNAVAEERDRVIRETLSVRLPRGVSLRIPAFVPKKKQAECSFGGASTLVVGIDGEVYPCCVFQSLDYEGRPGVRPMGNVFEDQLESIWNSQQYTDFRLTMLSGRTPSVICLSCPFFYTM